MQARNDQMAQQRAAQEQEQRKIDLVRRSMGGDQEALTELATISLDDYGKIDKSMRDKDAQEIDTLGQAALQLMNSPPANRASQLQLLAQQMPQYAEKIMSVAQMDPASQESALQSVIFQAGLTRQMQQMLEPDYRTLGPGEVIVDVKNQAAVNQFAAGGGSPQAAQGPVSFEQFMTERQRVGPKAADALAMQSVVKIQNPEQIAFLPSGAVFETPDGRQKVKP